MNIEFCAEVLSSEATAEVAATIGAQILPKSFLQPTSLRPGGEKREGKGGGSRVAHLWLQSDFTENTKNFSNLEIY